MEERFDQPFGMRDGTRVAFDGMLRPQMTNERHELEPNRLTENT